MKILLRNVRMLSTPVLLLFLSSIPLSISAQVDLDADSTNFQSKVTIDNVLENNGIKYPLVDGTNGQILSTDGSGELYWASQGDRVYLNDYAFASCMNIPGYLIHNSSFSNDSCGNLFDSGGLFGDYGNNEDHSFSINSSGSILTRVILKSCTTENNKDTLWIGDSFYTGTLAQADTLIFRGDQSILIKFYSDTINTDPGFWISWDRFYYLGSAVPAPFAGFYFDPVKSSVGGGVQIDDAWVNSGNESVFFGMGAKASGDQSTAIGSYSQALGNFSSAVGYLDTASGNSSSAIGRENLASGSQSSAVGHTNNVLGNSSSAFGYFNLASGDESNSIGSHNLVSGEKSSAYGFGNTSHGQESSAFGAYNYVSNNKSSAFGYFNTATALYASAFGSSNTVFGEASAAFGHQLTAGLYGLTVIGRNNKIINGSYTEWIAGDPAFVIGIGVNSSDRKNAMVIEKNGNVGIGTDNPEHLVHFTGDMKAEIASGAFDFWVEAADSTESRILSLNSGKDLYLGDLDDFGGGLSDVIIRTAGQDRMIINNAGDVAIGKSPLNYLFELNTNSAAKPGGGLWTAPSDRRLKKNISTYKEGLDKIIQLNPINYQYTEDSGYDAEEIFVGVIAQELQHIAPYMVSETEDGYLAVDPSALVYMLINAVKEQQAEISAEKQLNEEQQAVIEMLLKRLEALENKSLD